MDMNDEMFGRRMSTISTKELLKKLGSKDDNEFYKESKIHEKSSEEETA